MTQEEISVLNSRFEKKPAEEVLSYFLKEFKGKIALSSSLGAEDQVLTDMIATIDKETPIFTLDTGRLFPETYDLIDETNKQYNIKIQVYFPDFAKVEQMVKEKGMNLFYDSLENRKLCCHIRKIESLKRAFKGLDVWICGLRHEQSVTRIATKMVEWDEQHNLVKVNPLIEWEEKEVWDYIHNHNVPFNTLHDKGFPSIGCQPCTRAIKPGEDIRAGRWWWEEPVHRECGLHVREK
ncbi:MAG: phosphoadenylyl-sulfate reductase [Bacteroidota bacterium]|nr:phosphoadenylyl-sulfate reductase [Bacteroidota bacterium]MDP4227529.1 phosphoadenylyl-sulfate reductase [Bacteroidota bacterium]MDP4272927.1 phosphoadenylyl-sulfate reductase [Bacteroidota bacterium]